MAEPTQWQFMTLEQRTDETPFRKASELSAWGASGWEYDGDLESTYPGVEVRLLRRPINNEPSVDMMTATMSVPQQAERRRRYVNTTGYLPHPEDQNINKITAMINLKGNDGWIFTAGVKEVQNGTFYFFYREVD